MTVSQKANSTCSKSATKNLFVSKKMESEGGRHRKGKRKYEEQKKTIKVDELNTRRVVDTP